MDNPFDAVADRYDAWFDLPEGRALLERELDCLRPLVTTSARPWLEVGVGTGRFAQALGVEEGLDPSLPMLEKAAARSIRVQQGVGECLPYGDGSFGGVLLVVTVCFLRDPIRAFTEAARVLRPGGRLVVGIIPADSPWGEEYARKGAAGHPIYSKAQFYTTQQVVETAQAAGFHYVVARSCLHSPPGSAAASASDVRQGIVPGAGFVALGFTVGASV
jgi:SAM-dependent methyltransferase